MCKISILSSHALLENNVDFVKKSLFLEQKPVKLGIQKPLWQPKLQTFFETVFCSVWLKDQAKMCKITILSFHALPEKERHLR